MVLETGMNLISLQLARIKPVNVYQVSNTIQNVLFEP